MRLTRALHLAPLVLLALTPTARSGPIADEVVAPTVTVSTGTHYGTGTVIVHGGKVRVLTAAHVIEDMAPSQGVKITSKIPGKKGATHTRHARVVRLDLDVDLALLEPEGDSGLTPAALGLDVADLEPGEDCWYCGCGGGLGWNLQRTIVNQDDADWTTVNGFGWYGHSGSGVFVRRDGKWVLVGVLVQLHEPRNPKSPLRCVTRCRIKAFLAAP